MTTQELNKYQIELEKTLQSKAFLDKLELVAKKLYGKTILELNNLAKK